MYFSFRVPCHCMSFCKQTTREMCLYAIVPNNEGAISYFSLYANNIFHLLQGLLLEDICLIKYFAQDSR